MKIAKSQLKKIIEEELKQLLYEKRLGWRPGDKPMFKTAEEARAYAQRAGRPGDRGKEAPSAYAPSWRQAVKTDAGIGSFDDVEAAGTGEYEAALEKSEKEQVAAGADPEDIGVPHIKRRKYIDAAERAKKRIARRKEREALRKADAEEGPMTTDDEPMSIDANLLDAPTMQEEL